MAEGDTPAQLLARWCAWWRRRLTGTDFTAGCPLVAAVADAAAAVEDARAVLVSWQAEAAGVLERAGHAPDRAASLAAVLVSAVEGAVARAQRSVAPLDAVERELAALLG